MNSAMGLPLLLTIGFPIVLAVILCSLQSNLRRELLIIAVAALTQVSLTIVLEVLPQGGFHHHGNSLHGYATILLLPYVLVLTAVLIVNRMDLARNGRSILLLISIPLSYWIGLACALSVSLTLGWAVG